ncbi:MAG: efflux RND transporter periplasmic adaptor subunit [Prevotella sp.]
MNKEKILLSCLSLILFSACRNTPSVRCDVRKVNISEAVSVSRPDSVSFPGTTRSAEEVNVSFRVSGPLTKVLVNEGDYVSQGQVLATMDSRDYQVQLAATQAEYARVKADAERVISMYREGTTTAQNYDQARYGLQQITQKLENHRNQLSDTRLTAPLSGYVKERLHEAGETVSAGMPIVTLSSGDRVEVEINVSARDYARLSRLSSFRCRIDALGGQTLPLERVRTSAVANATQLYTLRFAIKGSYDRRQLTPGMSTLVYAQVSPESSSDVFIPSSALLDKNGHTSVFVYSPDGRLVKRRDVRVSTVNPDGTATVSGLRAGESVVSAGVRYLVDGQRVEPVKAPAPTNAGGLL